MQSLFSLYPTAQKYIWLALLIATAVNGLLLQGFGVARLLLLASILILWVWGVVLVRKRRVLSAGGIVAGLAVLGFLCLPGREVNPEQLRAVYTRSLRQYEGTRYVWGGESRLGIDCSGLVRQGLIDANLKLGASTLNPRPIRAALDRWWNDCSAKALQQGYRGFTQPLLQAESINDITHPSLRAGDIAVIGEGVHVLAYLGSGKWIEAEPADEVVIIGTPSQNAWFDRPVCVMRWRWLQGGDEG
ncbi:MAG: NlpC/P60 family protein [Armatimonadota bacterium]